MNQAKEWPLNRFPEVVRKCVSEAVARNETVIVSYNSSLRSDLLHDFFAGHPKLPLPLQLTDDEVRSLTALRNDSISHPIPHELMTAVVVHQRESAIRDFRSRAALRTIIIRDTYRITLTCEVQSSQPFIQVLHLSITCGRIGSSGLWAEDEVKPLPPSVFDVISKALEFPSSQQFQYENPSRLPLMNVLAQPTVDDRRVISYDFWHAFQS